MLPFFPKKFVWVFSKKYIAGESLDDAIRVSKDLNAGGMKVTLDVLGEFITNLNQAEENKKDCPCTYSCDTKGMCCECIKHHRERGELPACYFSKEAEKTYDRSIENFIENYKK